MLSLRLAVTRSFTRYKPPLIFILHVSRMILIVIDMINDFTHTGRIYIFISPFWSSSSSVLFNFLFNLFICFVNLFGIIDVMFI